MSQAWLTTAQASVRLQMSTKEIKTMRERHGLPHMSVGKGYRYPMAAVTEWERERTVAHGSSEGRAQPRTAFRQRNRGPDRRSTQSLSGRNLLRAG